MKRAFDYLSRLIQSDIGVRIIFPLLMIAAAAALFVYVLITSPRPQ